MDAVPFIIATKGAGVTKPKQQYDMLRRFRELLQWRKGDAIILGEANVLPGTDMEYFGDEGERLHMMFNFQVNQNLFYALATADSRLWSGRWPRPSRDPQPRNGAYSCATTTSSISDGSRPRNASG